MVRQLGKPDLLAAIYSSNAAAAAAAAMDELEEALLGGLQELQRIGSGVGGSRAGAGAGAGLLVGWLPSLCVAPGARLFALCAINWYRMLAGLVGQTPSFASSSCPSLASVAPRLPLHPNTPLNCEPALL